jgi:hypothetical protein
MCTERFMPPPSNLCGELAGLGVSWWWCARDESEGDGGDMANAPAGDMGEEGSEPKLQATHVRGS